MFAKQYKAGSKIPTGMYCFFVLLHGHHVRTVDLKDELIFPPLENPEMVYVAFG